MVQRGSVTSPRSHSWWGSQNSHPDSLPSEPLLNHRTSDSLKKVLSPKITPWGCPVPAYTLSPTGMGSLPPPERARVPRAEGPVWWRHQEQNHASLDSPSHRPWSCSLSPDQCLCMSPLVPEGSSRWHQGSTCRGFSWQLHKTHREREGRVVSRHTNCARHFTDITC